jgi:hypothetical protein
VAISLDGVLFLTCVSSHPSLHLLQDYVNGSSFGGCSVCIFHHLDPRISRPRTCRLQSFVELSCSCACPQRSSSCTFWLPLSIERRQCQRKTQMSITSQGYATHTMKDDLKELVDDEKILSEYSVFKMQQTNMIAKEQSVDKGLWLLLQESAGYLSGHCWLIGRQFPHHLEKSCTCTSSHT